MPDPVFLAGYSSFAYAPGDPLNIADGANGKVYFTAGTIRVPECFRCPTTCRFEAETTQFWSKGSKNWQCQPDIVITSIFP